MQYEKLGVAIVRLRPDRSIRFQPDTTCGCYRYQNRCPLYVQYDKCMDLCSYGAYADYVYAIVHIINGFNFGRGGAGGGVQRGVFCIK